MFSNPSLGGHLHGIPGRAERRRVREVEFRHAIDGHGVEESGGVGINPFSGLGAFGADQLGAKQLAGGGVTGDADVDGPGAGIVRLVVIGLAWLVSGE